MWEGLWADYALHPPTPSRLFLQITCAKRKPSGTRLNHALKFQKVYLNIYYIAYSLPFQCQIVIFYYLTNTVCMDEMPYERCKIFKDGGRCENYITQVFCRVSCGLCIPGKGNIFDSWLSKFNRVNNCKPVRISIFWSWFPWISSKIYCNTLEFFSIDSPGKTLLFLNFW